MRFLLLFAQFAILASSLHAAPVFPSHRRIWRRQTDGSIPQPSPVATPDDAPSQLAQILGAACNAANGGTCSRDLTQLEGIVQNIVNDLILAFSMVAAPCDAGGQANQPASPSTIPDPSDVGPVSDQSDPSRAQLDDFGGPNDGGEPGLDDASTANGFGSDDGSTADGFGSFGDSTLQGASNDDDELGDLGALNDTGDADDTGTPSASDDGSSQSAASSTSGSGDPNSNADPTDGALGDVAILDPQDSCSGSPCSGSDDPSLGGFPTIHVSSGQGPDANSGSGAELGLTSTGDSGSTGSASGTGDLSNNGVDTANGSGASTSEGLDGSDSDATRNAISVNDLSDSGHHTGVDAANLGSGNSQTGDGAGSASSPAVGGPPVFGVPPPTLPNPDSSSQTGLSSASSGPSSAGNNDASARVSDPLQSDPSAASGGSFPILGGSLSSPPSVASSAGSNDPSSASNNGAEGLNANGLPLSSGSAGSQDGISGTDGSSGVPVDASRVSAPGSGSGNSGNGSGDNSVPQAELVAPTFSTGDGTGPAAAGSLPGSGAVSNGGASPPAGSDGDGDNDDEFVFGVQRNGLGGGDDIPSPPNNSTPNDQPPSTATCAISTGDLTGHAEVSIPDVLHICASTDAHV